MYLYTFQLINKKCHIKYNHLMWHFVEIDFIDIFLQNYTFLYKIKQPLGLGCFVINKKGAIYLSIYLNTLIILNFNKICKYYLQILL